jgi:hypothetical protein
LGGAQSGTSSLSGTITDANQAVVQGAEVTLSNLQTGYSRKAASDDRGNYQFLQLPPATYIIEVSASGFAPIKREGVQLLVSVPSTLNFTVEVQGQTVTLEVTGEPAHVNTTDATLGNAFNNRQIMDLPFEGRNVVEILSLQPGVTYTGASGLGSGSPVDRTQDTRNGSVNGGRSDQANITLDGVDNNDQNNGFAFEGALRSTLDSVEEFRVTTANSNADAGRSSGAQVTLVTKTGKNQFHGSAYEYNRSGIGEANEWFNKNSQITNGQPNKPGHLVRNTFGATLGGPIKRDRAFFFLNWEAQRKQETTQTTRIVPSDNLRNGIVSYACVNVAQPGGAPADPLCVPSDTTNVTIAAATGLGPGQLLATFKPGTLQLLDPNCSGKGTCPSGPGPNPDVQAIFAGYPHANASSGANANAVADGFNYQGYNFAGATALKLNTYIAKLDFNLTQNGNHRLFVRGNLQGDRFADVPQYPGSAATQTTVVPSKGLAVGYTAVVSPTLINNFRYGFVRQAIDIVGSGNKSFISLRGIDTPHGDEFRSSAAVVPVHNFVDDVSWTRGQHTLQVGANFRMIGDLRNSTLTSFSGGSTNASWLDVSGIANKGLSLDPAALPFAGLNLPAVDAGFNNSYDYPVMALVGIVSEVDTRYNFDTKGQTLPAGTPNIRHFLAHEFETYVQDSWRIKSNLTLTYGLRWTLLQPPYEKNGVQVAPTVSLNRWFQQRGQTMATGDPFNQPIQFDLAGQANHRKPYWGYDYKNFAPRLAVAYSPGFDGGWLGHLFGGQGKSSIRMGAGMYFDHFGEGIVNTFDKNGSFGLSTLLSNPGGSQGVDSAPRIDANGIYTLPPSLITPSPGASFPVTFPLDNFAVQWGLDDKLKTPYSYAFDFSFERELQHNFVIETAYVGRIAHHLLQQEDMGQPRDIVDPASKTDYYSAIRQLDVQADAGAPEASVAPIPYWENLFGTTSSGAGFDTTALGCPSGFAKPANPTATQNMYELLANCGLVHNETTFQQIIDGVGGNSCFPGCITLKGVTATTPQYFASQFASLYAWRSIGNSAYHAAQLLLKHPMSHGVQFDFNYTFSKSIDMGSDAERIGGTLDSTSGLGDQIYNAWNPKRQRAISTFDTTHQLNSNWIVELPFGRGRAFGANVGRALDTALGGWQLTGLLRWTSGFPVSVNNGAAWATNWDLGAYATQIAPAAKTGVFRHSDGSVGLFGSPTTASGSYRQDFPGEVGGRNTLRGPGYFGADMGMDKTFKISENHQIRFSWEVFNVFNTVRFNVQSAGIEPDVQTTFGNFSNTLTQARRMQFALRYSF